MQKGAFISFWHEHSFEKVTEGTIMTDTIRYEVPFGPLGRFFDALILKQYMQRLIASRNELIRQIAESDSRNIYITTEPE